MSSLVHAAWWVALAVLVVLTAFLVVSCFTCTAGVWFIVGLVAGGVLVDCAARAPAERVRAAMAVTRASVRIGILLGSTSRLPDWRPRERHPERQSMCHGLSAPISPCGARTPSRVGDGAPLWLVLDRVARPATRTGGAGSSGGSSGSACAG